MASAMDQEMRDCCGKTYQAKHHQLPTPLVRRKPKHGEEVDNNEIPVFAIGTIRTSCDIIELLELN